MSKFTTTWSLDFLENVTSPLKKMMKNFSSVSKSADEFGNTVKFTQKEASEALENTKQDFNRLKTSIRENEMELKKLEKAYQDAATGTMQAKAKQAFEQQKQKVES